MNFKSDSIGVFVSLLLGDFENQATCPEWPPDVFAIAGYLLERSGAYYRVVEITSAGKPSLLRERWPEIIKGIGQSWRKFLDKDSENLPEELSNWWNILKEHSNVSIESIAFPGNEKLCEAVVGLFCAADEAAAYVGIKSPGSSSSKQDLFLNDAMNILASKSLLSLCKRIELSKCRVLPKQHTPQCGLTLRSLSHHLALCTSTDVQAFWVNPRPDLPIRLEPINLLLFPWPEKIDRNRFGPIVNSRSKLSVLASKYDFFSFSRDFDEDDHLMPKLEKAFREAKKFVSGIHGLVFPELSLTNDEYTKVLQFARQQNVFLIGGWLNNENAKNASKSNPKPAPAPTQNLCVFDFLGFYSRIVNPEGNVKGKELKPHLFGKMFNLLQMKHHRWLLNRSQILQYGLGGFLSPNKNWWEFSEVGERKVHFITLDEWLTVCALICEDLARQDPVAQVIRSVGPNLVIALLMDGPQIKNRWSSRYAAVLSDDPGCSVLCITSLGMSELSRPLGSEDLGCSRAFGLWRDIRTGEQELRLDPGMGAAVLSLSPDTANEWTADGRSHGSGYFPVFAGFHQIDTVI